MKLYVGNLSYNTAEGDLRQLFEKAGKVTAVNMITDRSTGRSKGFGFVEMENQADADKAISDLNDTELDGRKIKVSIARPPEKKEFSSRGGGERHFNKRY